MKKFKLLNLEDEDVLGGEVTEDNCYIKTYGATLPGYKGPSQLEVGESCLQEYRLSGQKGTYKVVRVE